MALTGVIGVFKTGTYSVSRAAAGSYLNGRYIPVADSSVSISASIQPMNGRELQVLPESHHSENTRKLYTTTELFTRTDSQRADRLQIDGKSWEVETVERWEAFGDTHYKVMIVLIVL